MELEEAQKTTPPKRKRGRPPKVTTSEKKRRMKEADKKYKRTMVSLSFSHNAWNDLRKKGKWSHGELAAHLLDIHSRSCKQCTSNVTVAESEEHITETQKMEQTTGPGLLKIVARFEKSSNKIAPVPDPGAEIVASFRPIRSKEELKASCATGSTVGEKNVTILPKPVRNQNDASKPESNAASVSVDRIVAFQENMTENSEGEQEQEEQEEEGEEEDGNEGEIAQEEVVPEEVEMQEPSKVDDFLNFQENLEPDEKVIKDGNGSDFDNEGCEKDSGWTIALDSDLIFRADDDEEGYSSEEGESLKKNRQKLDHGVADLPFKRFNTAEVAKAEGVSSTGSNRNRIRKLYWTEMERVYRCKLCLFEDSNAYITTGHLLREHAEIVGDFVDYLKERPATDPESGSTLYDMVMEFPPSSDGTDATNKGSESCDKIGEEKDSVEFPEEESKANESKAKETGRMEKKDNPFDTMESVELLKRWVKLQISCQHCQQGFNSYLFNDKGERTIHKCRLGKVIPVLCDVCGKSFKHQSAFKIHWTETHCTPEQTVCPYCGKMVRVLRLSAHILERHISKKDEHLCGICRKGFRTKHGRDAHEVIHQKEKPFKCSYCQRGFTQSSNMRYHMRQHTGEKPYHCEICPESFAHNVSLKNHLKSKHGIDPWKMDATGD